MQRGFRKARSDRAVLIKEENPFCSDALRIPDTDVERRSDSKVLAILNQVKPDTRTGCANGSALPDLLYQ